MPVINSKTQMVLGTNYKYHLVDFQGTDLSLSQSSGTITSTTTDFTASSESGGLVKRAIRVGDRLTVSNTTNAANEEAEAIVTAVAANQLNVTWLTGGVVEESAGADINITAFVKEFEFLEAGGLSFIDGVEGIVWASVVVDDWDAGDFDIYPKIFTSIEPRAKSIAALYGWRPLNAATENSIRGTALEIRPDPNSAPTQIFALFQTTGTLDEPTDQMTYWSDNDPELDAPNLFVMTGYADQIVKIYDRDIDLNRISGATQTNPVVLTLEAGHSFVDGSVVQINDVVGMTELNGNTYTLGNVSATTAELISVDGTVFGAYASGGDLAIDNRGTWNYRCLVPGKTHIQAQVLALFAEGYALASNNGLDPKLADGVGNQLVSDATVAGGGIYANIQLYEDLDSQYDGDVNGSNFSFLGFVDADSQDNQAVHTKMHYLLRQPTSINSDAGGRAIRGDKAPPITTFLGDQLTVDRYYLLNFNNAERNDLRLVDDSGSTQSWPTIRAITITAPTLAVTGTFSLIHKDTYGASSPTYLENDVGAPQKDIPIASATSIVVAFSTYNVDGHIPGTPLPLVLTWNRPGFIEPDFNDTIVLSNSDLIVPITPSADPSYTAA